MFFWEQSEIFGQKVELQKQSSKLRLIAAIQFGFDSKLYGYSFLCKSQNMGSLGEVVIS